MQPNAFEPDPFRWIDNVLIDIDNVSCGNVFAVIELL